MGRDKALLRIGGKTLLERSAERVREAAGNVVIVAEPSRYAHFGFPVIPDREFGKGPLGGIVAALEATVTDWNLVVAVDMPGIETATLEWLIGTALPGEFDCVAPIGDTGPEPLCAMYRRRALPTLRNALDLDILKMRTVLSMLDTAIVEVPFPAKFNNINTPEDWAAHG